MTTTKLKDNTFRHLTKLKLPILTARFNEDYYRFLALTKNPTFVEEIEEIRQFFAGIGFEIIEKEVKNIGLQHKWINEFKDSINKIKPLGNNKYKFIKKIKIPNEKREFILFGSKLKEIMDNYGLDPENKDQYSIIQHYFFTKEIINKQKKWMIGILDDKKSKTINNKLAIILEPEAQFKDVKLAYDFAKIWHKDYFNQVKKHNLEKDWFERDLDLYKLYLKARQKTKSTRQAMNVIFNKTHGFHHLNQEFEVITNDSEVSRDFYSKINRRMAKLLKGVKLFDQKS